MKIVTGISPFVSNSDINSLLRVLLTVQRNGAAQFTLSDNLGINNTTKG